MLTFRNPEDKTSCIVLNLLKTENQRSTMMMKKIRNQEWQYFLQSLPWLLHLPSDGNRGNSRRYRGSEGINESSSVVVVRVLKMM